MCDFAVATTDAGIGLPEERLGSAGATWAYPFLILNVGLKRANEIVMTGRRFSAEEARQMGLVNRVVEHPSSWTPWWPTWPGRCRPCRGTAWP